jgi:hypothetical protein
MKKHGKVLTALSADGSGLPNGESSFHFAPVAEGISETDCQLVGTTFKRVGDLAEYAAMFTIDLGYDCPIVNVNF